MQNDSSNIRRQQFAQELIDRAASHFERRKLLRGTFNIGAARLTHDAARLLGFHDLSDRLSALLRSITVDQLLDGAISSVARTEELSTRPLSQKTLEQIQQDFPWFHDAYVADLLTSCGTHLQACLTRDYERALAEASSEMEQAEVALAQLVLRDFEVAQTSFSKFPSRIEDLRLVLAIEMARENRIDEAKGILEDLLANDLDWTPTLAALGISERVPWPYYPLPDY